MPPDIALRLDRLRARGCTVDGPVATAGGWTCSVRLPDGRGIAEDADSAAQAAHAAAEAAERLLDPVEEASIESFPASDPPGFGGGTA